MRTLLRSLRARLLIALALLTPALAPGFQTSRPTTDAPADLIITGGRVYTLDWGEPGRDGAPAADAPRDSDGWRPDAEAVVIAGGRILFVGSADAATRFEGEATRVIDVAGASVLPGLVDSHTHVFGLGAGLTQVDLTGVETEEEAIARAVAFVRERNIPRGQWVLGKGWDEGAWADRYPTSEKLTAALPDHPVVLDSLHGFAIWGNKRALDLAGITSDTPAPSGGEILKDAQGDPTGILLNRATALLDAAVPAPSIDQLKQHALLGLRNMAEHGYVAVHEAGVDSRMMEALEALDAEGELPLRFYAMLSARDEALCRAWLEKGPQATHAGMLTVRSVKAYYDGALGSRGARLIEDYSDMPGHRGTAGDEYGFDQALVAAMMKAGFQVAIHAIGDAGNRETLDFIQRVIAEQESVRDGRHRIEHAQVVHPDDFARFAELNLIASMEPPHAMEDKLWAVERIGPERIQGAYAWRTLRRAGAALTFNSDLPGSDWDIFYGLHSAIARRDKDLQPPDGWFPAQRMTPEEAVRGYTNWAAYSAFADEETGVLAAGRWADVTVMNIDPFTVGETDPAGLLKGSIRLTVAAGKIVFDSSNESGSR